MGVGRRKTDASNEHISQALELTALEAAKQAARKTANRAAGGYFVLLLFLMVGAVLWQQSTNKRLDHAEMRACERLQVQRERTNVSEARQFLLLSAVAASPRASKTVKGQYDALARTTLYDPPTDCVDAVRHPGSYKRPQSVLFVVLPERYVQAIVTAAKQKRPQPVPSP